MPGLSLPSRSIVSRLRVGVVGNARGARPARMRGHLEQSVELAQRGRQRIHPITGHTHDDDAGELAGQLGELAVLPVAVVRGDDVREGTDEAGAVVADDGEHESGHLAILCGCSPG